MGLIKVSAPPRNGASVAQTAFLVGIEEAATQLAESLPASDCALRTVKSE